ncbi:MAG: hypothetical protein NT034_00925 [Candidatus Magasanikbacteria bacterium]|nr:hypothetical protein [Candidatus Magasanikbacteria bacterium]
MVANKKEENDSAERVIIKLPKSLAAYFRNAFAHGKRSEFITQCILEHKHQVEIKEMEEKLRAVVKKRQK